MWHLSSFTPFVLTPCKRNQCFSCVYAHNWSQTTQITYKHHNNYQTTEIIQTLYKICREIVHTVAPNTMCNSNNRTVCWVCCKLTNVQLIISQLSYHRLSISKIVCSIKTFFQLSEAVFTTTWITVRE